MTTPNTFKGFGIPKAITLLEAREDTRAEIERLHAAYIRQGCSIEKALHLVSISIAARILRQDGFDAPGKDFSYDSALGGVRMSDGAWAYWRDTLPPGEADRILGAHRIPHPLDMTGDEVGDHPELGPVVAPRSMAKVLVRLFLGMPVSDGVTASITPDMAGEALVGLLVDDGLPEEDVADLMKAALADEDGAALRLLQRVQQAIPTGQQRGDQQ